MISLTLGTESYIVESSSSQVSCNVAWLIMPRQFSWVGKASKILPKVVGLEQVRAHDNVNVMTSLS